MHQIPLVILGAGYTGRWIVELLRRRGLPFVATSRNPDTQLGFAPPQQRLRFDLADPETWTEFPAAEALIWAFPATPVEQVREFMRRVPTLPRRLVVLGSTSAYDNAQAPVHNAPPWLDESAPIDHRLPRVQGEEYLRAHHGAIVLRIAGIYGPGRNPVDWIRQGRVGRSEKFVNLIHVEDLADIVLCALERGTAGEIYNVSDGTPRTWNDIAREFHHRWAVPLPQLRAGADRGKRICTKKLRAQIRADLLHPDLYCAIERMG
jgi:nucleoside-diphosphate-sugar epimerase